MQEKIRTTIYLDKDIKDFCKSHKLNLSDWVNNKIRNEFLGLDSKTKELEQIKRREEELKEEIKLIKERTSNLCTDLTQTEKRFLYNVPERLKRGFDLKAIHNLFNHDFNRNYTYDEFVALYQSHEKMARERLASVVYKNKSKK